MVKNQIGLMRNIEAIGHRLIYFTAGRYDFKGVPYLRSRIISGLKAFELVNSPNPYDPYCYRTNPVLHCSDITIEKMTQEVVDTVNPCVVHISDMRMHCASIIKLLKSKGIPVVKTFHNYWDLCPKGDLLYNDQDLCLDFGEGHKCLQCLAAHEPGKIPLLHRVKGAVPYEYIFPIVTKMKSVKSRDLSPRITRAVKPVAYSAGAYRKRREYFVNMLNACDAIHVTSRNVGRFISRFGINSHNIVVIPLSADGLSNVDPKPDFSFHFPVTFGYRGRLHKRKGIYVLLDAFSHLDQKKCRLLIYGDGDPWILKPYLDKGLNIEYRGSYEPSKTNQILKEIDIGIVPSIWEEIFGIVGLEYINARIPVVASNIGGIPEWLKQGENGCLFPPGDSRALSRIMKRFLDEPQTVLSLQKKIKRWKTVRTYASEINSLYERKIRGG